MTFNTCETCGACDGRCGLTISSPTKPTECMNCYDTRKTGDVVIHLSLIRTEQELAKTMAILNN